MVRVKDLKNQIGTNGPRPILYCAICQSGYSANRGDYFQVTDDHIFRCCGEPMRLVIRKVVFEEVRQ